MMTIDVGEKKHSEIRRLVLAKKLYLHGCGHGLAKDKISRMLAIHHFDNAVEIVLKCIATKCNIASSSRQENRFKDLWDIIRQNVNLPLKDQMFSLHDLRNLIQHQGDIPSMESVIKYKGYTEDFFIKVCSEIFGIPYEKLYLSELFENEKLREQVLAAETAFERGEYKRCIELCDGAFISATYEEADIFGAAGLLTGYWGASEELKMVISEDYPEKYKGKDFYELAKELSRTILQLGQAATGMQFIDDYKMDFLKYRQIVETLWELPDNELKDSAEFSLSFITNLILKWQEEGMFRRDRKNDLSSYDSV